MRRVLFNDLALVAFLPPLRFLLHHFNERIRAMPIASHMTHLQEKHARLEGAIAEELSRPLPNGSLVTAYKKQKLMIKQELQRLQLTEETMWANAA
jgi:hypothetical protein